MSSSAALAAAKKRRNVTFGQGTPNNQTSQVNEKVVRSSVSPGQLLYEHDKKLFNLEQKLIQMSSLSLNKEDLELLKINSESKLDNNIINRVEANTTDVQSLKNQVNRLMKSLNETNSLVTTLKASLLVQTNKLNELNQLRLDFDQLRIELNRKNENKEESDESEGGDRDDEGDKGEENDKGEEEREGDEEKKEVSSNNQIKLEITEEK